MAARVVTDDFFTLTGVRLGNSSFLTMFNILQDDDGTKFINIFRAYEIDQNVFADIVYYSTYETENVDFWEQISWKMYGIVELWWAICLMNNIRNPFEDMDIGINLNILKNDYMPQLLREIRAISEK